MKARKTFTVSILTIALISLTGESNAGDQNIKIGDITGDFDTVARCRCKKGGCYGGNAISFRSACAKGDDATDCSEHKSNCPE